MRKTSFALWVLGTGASMMNLREWVEDIVPVKANKNSRHLGPGTNDIQRCQRKSSGSVKTSTLFVNIVTADPVLVCTPQETKMYYKYTFVNGCIQEWYAVTDHLLLNWCDSTFEPVSINLLSGLVVYNHWAVALYIIQEVQSNCTTTVVLNALSISSVSSTTVGSYPWGKNIATDLFRWHRLSLSRREVIICFIYIHGHKYQVSFEEAHILWLSFAIKACSIDNEARNVLNKNIAFLCTALH